MITDERADYNCCEWRENDLGMVKIICYVEKMEPCASCLVHFISFVV